MIGVSCISLFSTWPKLDYFCAKKFTFGLSLFYLSKTVVALLVAFTAADRFFKRLYEPDTKQANKRCRLYTSLFLDMNTKFSTSRMICSRKISVFCATVQSILVPSPTFGSCPFTLFALSTALMLYRSYNTENLKLD